MWSAPPQSSPFAVAVVLVLVAALERAGEQLGGARVGRSHRRMLVGREGLELRRAWAIGSTCAARHFTHAKAAAAAAAAWR